eukprot:gnl/MRDRNA2_/MRDRNA2_64816_c0_seq2.p1 gnl/MRDRNA2_/MRDRNA2_64816_c0~~gnl/MRDRNA2_/MRDRNA2_64816_c0_seq2.p1  ORF type:complete len:236 (+),score=11.28 gnl/MRDRNA2_/MRDRNA2_64816_c0_seq2:64-771(+)
MGPFDQHTSAGNFWSTLRALLFLSRCADNIHAWHREDPWHESGMFGLPELGYVWPGINGSKSVPVPDPIAIRMAGPLTVLHVLKTCHHHEIVQQIIERARARKEVRIHITGVVDFVEPGMLWPEVLVGVALGKARIRSITNFSKYYKRILRHYGVFSPFSGLRLSMLFNGYRSATKMRVDLLGIYQLHVSQAHMWKLSENWGTVPQTWLSHLMLALLWNLYIGRPRLSICLNTMS